MRSKSIVFTLVAACYPQPAAQAPAAQQQVQGPPGGNPDSEQPQAYAGAEPQRDPWTEPTPQDQGGPPPPRRPPPPPPPPRPRAPQQNAFAQRFVEAHNAARAKHCAGALQWSPKLADVAQRWANSLRDQGCKFGHSGGQYGENLAAGTEGTLDPDSVVTMWYGEVRDYSFARGGFSMQTGHFTQVVWRNTTQVGCGTAKCNGNDIFVCNYDPAGNFEGEYQRNVLPTNCR